MANNPLQKSGPIRFRDIMLEKEWLGTESKSVSSMVEENDRLSPYLIINPYNPLSIKTNIQSKPYRVSDWYGYNHALTQDITVLDGLASFVNMKSMIKAVVESGPSKGFYANHYSVFNNLFSQAASGDADSISQSNQYLHAFNFFQVTERVTSLAGNYRITVQRAYGEISLSCISPGRQITAAEVILRGIAHTYTPCRMILVQYEQGSSWTISGWTTSMRAISEPVMFSLGDQTFKLNPLGVSLINSAIASQDKYLRFAVVTYDYDYLGEAYIGDNLLQGDDYSLETLGHWQEANTGSHLTRVLATTMNAKASSVLQLTHDAGYIPGFKIQNSYFSEIPTVDKDYYFHCQYRFDDFSPNTDPFYFAINTLTTLNGKTIGTYTTGLNSQFIRPQDPSVTSTNWFRGHQHTRLNNPEYVGDNTLYFRGGGAFITSAPGSFYLTDLRIVPILFTRIFGAKYDSPRLAYHYGGIPGGVSTGSVIDVTTDGATVEVVISSDGYTDILQSGVCWNTTGSPTITDNHTMDGNTTVSGFSSEIESLEPNTIYYVRAYITTEVGTSYGEQVSFTTSSTLPTVAWTSASLHTPDATTVTLYGNITSDGGSPVTDRGFVFKAGGLPSISDNKTSATTPTGTGSFSRVISNLIPGTAYQYRAYATNANGTSLCVSSGSFSTPTGFPVVDYTSPVSSITYTTARSGGYVSNDNSYPVTERGICWSTSQNPTRLDSRVTSGTGTGTFTALMTGLNPSTTYYVRSYAVNSQGTSYADQVSFITQAANSPVVFSTTLVSSITATGGVTGGNITSDGGSPITQRGVVYATTQNPTITSSKVIVAGTTGTFTATLTGLSPSTTYYVRAFATNAVGTSYASQKSFTTGVQVTLASVDTNTPSQALTNSFWLGCNVTADGNSQVTQKGVVVNTSGNPTTSLYIFKDTSSLGGVGSYDIQLSNLAWSTTYWVRSYAINGVGTAYGSQLSFTTGAQPSAPSVSTSTPGTITANAALFSGNVTSAGGGTVLERGFVYSSTQSVPTVSNASKIQVGSGTGTFSVNKTGLVRGTTYYVRSYAINEGATGYGVARSFTTDSLPTVTTTSPATSISASSARVSGTVSSDGGASVSARGICYSTSQNPTLSSSSVSSGSGTGTFSALLTGLSSSTTYYARAYATNAVGTCYGNQISFSTTSGTTVPSVIGGMVVERAEPTKFFDITNSQVVSDGGSAVTARGICFSTSNQSPTLSDSVVACDSGTGYFDATALIGFGLTMVYWRAYATNSVGTAYSSVSSFYKDGNQDLPTL